MPSVHVLRSVAEAECGPRNGTEQADNAEHHVEVYCQVSSTSMFGPRMV